MGNSVEIFKNWKGVLTEPKQVFAEEKANASLEKAVKIMFVAGIIASIITNMITITLIFSDPDFIEAFSLFMILLIVGTIILTPIIFLILSGILYGFAKLFRGKGNFITHTYLIALLSIPFTILETIASTIFFIGLFLIVSPCGACKSASPTAVIIIPFIGLFLGIVFFLYMLYLLTLALKEIHQYSIGKAILTWLIPFTIFTILLIIIIIGFLRLLLLT